MEERFAINAHRIAGAAGVAAAALVVFPALAQADAEPIGAGLVHLAGGRPSDQAPVRGG
ncbi:hypothetical protein ACL03H_00740 [Saccharopolyspora sp. MS10]|uniref:hypothetical protein n=1 Tax=Saccharopolyspora sp. MS10 TaxID=3385973 RepID=UPI0039A39323